MCIFCINIHQVSVYFFADHTILPTKILLMELIKLKTKNITVPVAALRPVMELLEALADPSIRDYLICNLTK